MSIIYDVSVIIQTYQLSVIADMSVRDTYVSVMSGFNCEIQTAISEIDKSRLYPIVPYCYSRIQ